MLLYLIHFCLNLISVELFVSLFGCKLMMILRLIVSFVKISYRLVWMEISEHRHSFLLILISLVKEVLWNLNLFSRSKNWFRYLRRQWQDQLAQVKVSMYQFQLKISVFSSLDYNCLQFLYFSFSHWLIVLSHL